MSDPYPDDADDDALRRVAFTGANMLCLMQIDFFVAVPDHTSGTAVAETATLAGYRAELIHDEEDDAWDCHCSKLMLPTVSVHALDDACSRTC